MQVILLPGAIAACLGGALCVEEWVWLKISQSLPSRYCDGSWYWSSGCFVRFLFPTQSSFNSFMFGSILTVSEQEVQIVWRIGDLQSHYSYFLRKELFLTSFDERHARCVGVPVSLINFENIIAVALVVAT